MFTVAAFLPFLPLIEDAMIRQLGDDDFRKRETATRFLHNVLQDTDGYRNYSALLKVKQAIENEDPEIRIRAQTLYDKNKSKYLREYPFFLVVLRGDNIGQRMDKTAWKNLERILGDLVADSKQWGMTTKGSYCITFRTDNFTSSKFYRLKAKKEFLEIVYMPSFKPHWDVLGSKR